MKNLMILMCVALLLTVPALAAETQSEVRFCVFETWPANAEWGTEVEAGTPVVAVINGEEKAFKTYTVNPPEAAHYYKVSPGWCEVPVPAGVNEITVRVGGVEFPNLQARPDGGPGGHFLIIDQVRSYGDVGVMMHKNASSAEPALEPAPDPEPEVTEPDPAPEPEVATESAVVDEPVVTESDPEPVPAESEVTEPEVAAADPEVTETKAAEAKTDEMAALKARVSALEAMLTEALAKSSESEPDTEEAPGPEPAIDATEEPTSGTDAG